MHLLLVLPLPAARCRVQSSGHGAYAAAVVAASDPRLGCCSPATLPEIAADLNQVGRREQEHNAGDLQRFAWKLYITDTSTSRSR
jgi:hypothetical protein